MSGIRGSITLADGITYDNSTTALNAENVQQAIDILVNQNFINNILNAFDVMKAVTLADQNTCTERVTQVQFTAASVSPTASATKILTYSNTGYEYQISGISWVLVP